MNKKGYMLYELIIAFILTTIIAIFLLSTAFKLNDKNQELTVRAKINVIQEDLTARFYKDFQSYMTTYFNGFNNDEIEPYCSFYVDNDKTITFGINKNNNTIYYNNYETSLPDGVVPISINCDSTYKYDDLGLVDHEHSIFQKIADGNKNSAITINIKLRDNVLNKDYDINILYLYQDFTVEFQS